MRSGRKHKINRACVASWWTLSDRKREELETENTRGAQEGPDPGLEEVTEGWHLTSGPFLSWSVLYLLKSEVIT